MDHGPRGDTTQEEYSGSPDRSTEDLDLQFGHSCSLGDALVSVVEAATHCHHGVMTPDCCSADEPQDGGGEGKRAAGSSQNNSDAHTGRSSVRYKAWLFIRISSCLIIGSQ